MVSQSEPAGVKRRRVENNKNSIFDELQSSFTDVEQRAQLCTEVNDLLTSSFETNEAIYENVTKGFRDVLSTNEECLVSTVADVTKKLESLSLLKEQKIEDEKNRLLNRIETAAKSQSGILSAYEELRSYAASMKEKKIAEEISLKKNYDELTLQCEEAKHKGNRIQQDIARLNEDEEKENAQTLIYQNLTTTESEYISFENATEMKAKEEYEACLASCNELEAEIEKLKAEEVSLKTKIKELEKEQQENVPDLTLYEKEIGELKSAIANINPDLKDKELEEILEINAKLEAELKELEAQTSELEKELEITSEMNIDEIISQVSDDLNRLIEAITEEKTKMDELTALKDEKEREEQELLENMRNEEQRHAQLTTEIAEITKNLERVEKKNSEVEATKRKLTAEIAELENAKEMLEAKEKEREKDELNETDMDPVEPQRASKTVPKKEPKKAPARKVTNARAPAAKSSTAKTTTAKTAKPSANIRKSRRSERNKELSQCITPATNDPKTKAKAKATKDDLWDLSSGEEDLSSYVPKVEGVESFSPKTKKVKKDLEAKSTRQQPTRNTRSRTQPKRKRSISSSRSSLSSLPPDNLIEGRFPHGIYLDPSCSELTSPKLVRGYEDDDDDDLNTTNGSMLF